jgi:hypothetical protein
VRVKLFQCLPCIKISIISKRTVTSIKIGISMPRHHGVPSGWSNMISEPKVGMAQTMLLCCIQMDRNEIPHDPRHIGVPFNPSETISEPMVRSAQTVHLSCVKISTISIRTETSFQLSLEPWSTIGGVQNDFEPMVRLAQTMHLSCTDTNTFSKWIKTGFHRTHIIEEFHRVRPK